MRNAKCQSGDPQLACKTQNAILRTAGAGTSLHVAARLVTARRSKQHHLTF
jgi:hypothetical protein